MARRRNIPTTALYVVGALAGVAAIGTVTYVVVRRLRSRTSIDWKKEGGCPPDGPYVGGAIKTWPHADLFLDETGFGEALESFGYDVGDWADEEWHVCDLPMQEAVVKFTQDYNAVRPVMIDAPVERLKISTLIKKPTIEAMAYVVALQRDAGYSWPLVVEEVRQSSEEARS